MKNFLNRFFVKWGLLSFVLGLLIFWGIRELNLMFLDWMTNQYYIRISADNVYRSRTLLLDLFFKVAPFMIPVVMATSSVMLNKYTVSYFNLTFQNKHVRRLFLVYIFYFSFHAAVATFSPIDTWEDKNEYFIHYFGLFMCDTIFAFIAFSYSIFTSLEIFLFAQPNKLSLTIKENISNATNQLNRLLFEYEKNDTKVRYNEELLSKSISMFTNLTVIAVKAKDYETIESNISTIGKDIWIAMIRQPMSYKTEDEKEVRLAIIKNLTKDFKGFKGYTTHEENRRIAQLTDERIEGIAADTRGLLRTVGGRISNVYKDIYESAFASKEFFASERIISFLTEITEDEKWVFETYVDLFEITLSYKYHGYTKDHCKKIISSVITLASNQKERDYDILYDLLKKCLEHDDTSALEETLVGIKRLLSSEDNDRMRENIYRNLRDAGVYTLHKKRMECFAVIMRFLVTRNLNISEMNLVFSRIYPPQASDRFEGIVAKLSYEEPSKLFSYEGDKKYLRLKFYVIFYSYYLLQQRISRDRISATNRGVGLDSHVYKNIPFDLLRTLILDLETHKENWEKLFVSQSEYYFVETIFNLFKPEEIGLLKEEITQFDHIELMDLLFRKNSKALIS